MPAACRGRLRGSAALASETTGGPHEVCPARSPSHPHTGPPRRGARGRGTAGESPRLGFLGISPAAAYATRIEGFRQGLRELGYIEGQNIAIEWRYANSQADRLPGLAAELVRLNVDVIVAAGVEPTRAAKQATTTIPIVMGQSGDPLGLGLVASLARPGGNITGLTILTSELNGKRLGLLHEAVPAPRAWRCWPTLSNGPMPARCKRSRPPLAY